jgi:hypothetical protein
MKQTSDGVWYYNSGTTLGKIGTNKWLNNTGYKGIVFDLENDAGYMCWAARDQASDTAYNVKLVYHHNNTIDKPGLHFHCNTYTHGNLYLTDKHRFIWYTDDSIGYDGLMKWVRPSTNTHYITINGNVDKPFLRMHTGSYFRVYEGVTVNFESNINMNGKQVTNQSDARLKTNIKPPEVDALGVIHQIELKQFDWIKSGEHEELGMIAQQLQTVCPELVVEDKDTGTLSIKTTQFIPYLIKAIQDLSSHITNDINTFALRRPWIDPYSDEEKEQFILSISDEEMPPPKEVEYTPITLPVD